MLTPRERNTGQHRAIRSRESRWFNNGNEAHAALVEVDAAAAEADAALLEAIMLEGMREALGADAPVRVDVRVCSSWAGSGE